MEKVVSSSKKSENAGQIHAESKRSHVMHVLQASEQSVQHGYALGLRQRLARAAGLSAVLGFILADYFSGGFTAFSTLDWQLIALFLPFLLLPLALTFPYPGHSSLRQYILIALFVLGMALAGYLGISRHHSIWFNQESLTLATIFIYFLSGLPLFRAAFCGLAAWLAFAISEMGDGGVAQVFSGSSYLLVANIVGALGLFYLEWHTRGRQEQELRLRSDAISDDLTGLLNGRAIHQHLRRVWRQACREECGLCVLRIDIDNFKELNRRVGGELGDSALRHIAALLEAEVRRPLDAVGRSGGDEFLAVWYDADPAHFSSWAQKLPKAVLSFPVGDSMDIKPLTISGGAVIAFPQTDEDQEWEQFIECIDENLARARHKGRNQIAVTELEQSPANGAEHWSIKTAKMMVTVAE